jgi:ankyrin repeat protein
MNSRTPFVRAKEEGTRILNQLLEKKGVEVTQILERLKNGQRFLVGTAAIEADMAHGTNSAVPLIQSGLLNEASAPTGSGYTPIHHAAAWGHVAAIEAFAGSGGDLNSPNCVGNAPLHFAVGSEQLKSVTALIANGADPEPTTFSTTPEQKALEKGADFHAQYIAAVEEGRQLWLAKNRDNPASRDRAGNTLSVHSRGGSETLAVPPKRLYLG